MEMWKSFNIGEKNLTNSYNAPLSRFPKNIFQNQKPFTTLSNNTETKRYVNDCPLVIDSLDRSKNYKAEYIFAGIFEFWLKKILEKDVTINNQK